MTKKTWLLIAIITAIWICLFPVFVLAESSYYAAAADECTFLYKRNGSSDLYIKTDRPVRMIAGKNTSNTARVFIISNERFSYSWGHDSCPTSASTLVPTTNSFLVDDVRYYMMTSTANSNGSFDNFNTDIPQYNQVLSNSDIVYYTYGDGAEDPVTPVNWGMLRDTSYTTRIAGSGQAARRNVDYLTWEKSIDANGNDILECQVEIQAVYGKFTGNTINDLWETDVQDLAIAGSVSLATVDASTGMFSVSWQKVIDDLNSFDFDSLFAHEVNEQIEKNGWYYQIRLLGSDGYIGSWQTLYTPLSIGAKASETIINNNSFDMSVYQVYQDLSTINNNTSITITYIDTDYTINNPNDGTEPEGGTNLWDVLKELISGIFQILAKLGDLVGNIIDGLMGIFQNLFTPSEVDHEINNNINVEVNTYLEESQPGLNQIHNNIDTWKLQLEDIANDYANGGDCIITWEDVSIDLSDFNAGTVTFIPGGQYDLKTAFISLLTAFGISYSTYEMIVSAIIYISLIVLISHKVKGFLKT